MQEEKVMVEENNSKNKETMLSNTHVCAWPQKGQKPPSIWSYCKDPARRTSGSGSKDPSSTVGFREEACIDKILEVVCRVWTSLWLIGGEVTGR